MNRPLRSLLVAWIALSACYTPASLAEDPRAAALRIHASMPVFDGHNDLPGKIRDAGGSFEAYDIGKSIPSGHTDLARLRKGGVGAQFWSAYVPVDEIAKGTASRYCREQIELISALCAHYPQDLELATNAADVERIVKSGKIASWIGIEGGHAIQGSLETLREFHRLGARYMTLTHNDTIEWADAATDAPQHGGLTSFGEEVVREMNALGMLVDISHVSADTMRDVLRVSRAPVIASHSCAFALTPHPRNVPDDVLRAMTANGGVVMVNVAPAFLDARAAEIALGTYAVVRRLRLEIADETARQAALDAWRKANPLPPVPLARYVDHIEYIARVAGVDHVGIGSDFDGVSATPIGLEDVGCLPAVTEELLRRGWNEADVRKVLGGNILRVVLAAEAVASLRSMR